MKRNRSMLFHPGLYGETLRQLRLMGSIYLVLCVVFTIVPALLDSLSGPLTQRGSATSPRRSSSLSTLRR